MICPRLGFTFLLLPALIACHPVSITTYAVYPVSPTFSCAVCIKEPAATRSISHNILENLLFNNSSSSLWPHSTTHRNNFSSCFMHSLLCKGASEWVQRSVGLINEVGRFSEGESTWRQTLHSRYKLEATWTGCWSQRWGGNYIQRVEKWC